MTKPKLTVDLAGKTALITGAGSGIGRAIALGFARNGANIVIADIQDDRGELVADEIREIGREVLNHRVDISRADDVNELAEIARKTFGHVDILVNNAGINVGPDGRKPVHEFSDYDWEKIISVDLNGPYHCTKAFLPGMIAQKSGRIINITSIVGIVPLRLQCAFTAAKAGLINFTRATAIEMGSHGINVNAIAPGSTVTEATIQFYNSQQNKSQGLLSHVPLGRPGTVEDISNAALFLASDASNYITGHCLVVDGGWTAGYARDW